MQELFELCKNNFKTIIFISLLNYKLVICLIKFLIDGLGMLVYTPGLSALAQPTPQDITPASSLSITMGPPESP